MHLYIYCMLPKSSLCVKLCMLGGKHQSVSQHKILLDRKVLNAVETCWKNLELTFWGLAVSNQCCQAVMKGN